MIDNSNPHRLSELIVPENYKIILKPNLNDHTFDGQVNINIDVIKNTDQIIINSAELLIKSVEIFSENAYMKCRISGKSLGLLDYFKRAVNRQPCYRANDS